MRAHQKNVCPLDIAEREHRDAQLADGFLRRKAVVAHPIDHQDGGIVIELLTTGVTHKRRHAFDHDQAIIVPKR